MEDTGLIESQSTDEFLKEEGEGQQHFGRTGHVPSRWLSTQ